MGPLGAIGPKINKKKLIFYYYNICMKATQCYVISSYLAILVLALSSDERFSFSWFFNDFSCYLCNFMLQLYAYGALKSTCKSRINVHTVSLPIARLNLFCRFFSSSCSRQSNHTSLYIDIMSALWEINILLAFYPLVWNTEYKSIHFLKALAWDIIVVFHAMIFH